MAGETQEGLQWAEASPACHCCLDKQPFPPSSSLCHTSLVPLLMNTGTHTVLHQTGLPLPCRLGWVSLGRVRGCWQSRYTTRELLNTFELRRGSVGEEPYTPVGTSPARWRASFVLTKKKRSKGPELAAALVTHQLPCELGHRRRSNPLPCFTAGLHAYHSRQWHASTQNSACPIH